MINGRQLKKCKEAAQILADWASLEGLLMRDQQPTQSLAELVPCIYPINDEGKSKLRARGIYYIGFNESDNTITAYLKKVAPNSKKFLENLPENVCGYPIKYRQGNVEQIGVSSNPPTPRHGRFIAHQVEKNIIPVGHLFQWEIIAMLEL